MADPSIPCPACGAPLIGRWARQLCPRCVIRQSLDGWEDTPEPEEPLESQTRFGDYELGRELGRGGMGVVYEARHLTLNRVVALKMLHPARLSSPALLQRFRHEAEMIAALDHPHILPIYDVGSVQGQPYFTMKLAEGGSLTRIPPISALSSRRECQEQVAIVEQIARAVHFAHQRGIQHRDLKPHNILMDAEGHAYVADFGLAKLAGQDLSLTATTEVLGSPAYMAPEQLQDEKRPPTNALDIYGLGAILYERLTGKPPFSGTTMPILLRQIVEEEVDGTAIVDASLRTVCLKCLSKEPAKRYASAEGLADDLRRWLQGEPVLARPISNSQRVWLWAKRRPALATAWGALVLVILGGIVGITVQWRRAEDHAWRQGLERYVSDLQVASQALEGHDIGLARTMLEAQSPSEGQPDYRGVEWSFLYSRVQGQHLSALTGHTATVTCVALSPDGAFAVSGGMDSTLRIWSLKDHQPLKRTIPAHSNVVWSVAWTPDGQRIISAGADGLVRFWTPDGQQAESPLPGVNAALSRDGRLLATSMSSPFKYFAANPGLTVWDLKTRRPLWETNVSARRVTLSPDGTWLAAGGDRRNVLLWNLRTGEKRTLTTTDTPWSIAFSPDGNQLAAAGFDLGARLWSLTESTDKSTAIHGHRFNVWSVAFSPDSRRIVTVGSDRTLRIRDLNDIENSMVLDGHDDEVWDVIWSQDGRSLLSTSKDTTVRIWPAQPSASSPEIPSADHWTPRLSRTGHRMLALEPRQGKRSVLTLVDLTTRTNIVRFDHRWVAGFGTNGEDLILLNDATLELEHWTSSTGQYSKGPLLEGSNPSRPGKRFTFSDDGTALIVYYETELAVYRVHDGKRLSTTPISLRSSMLGLALSPRGDYFAYSTMTPYTVWLHHTATGRRIPLNLHTEEVKGLAFSPDGKTLASASVDRSIRLWETQQGRLIGSLIRYYSEATAVSFSPDGRLLASIGTGQSVDLWHVATLRHVMTVNEPDAGDRIHFSPSNDAIAYTVFPNKVRLLQAEISTERERRP